MNKYRKVENHTHIHMHAHTHNQDDCLFHFAWNIEAYVRARPVGMSRVSHRIATLRKEITRAKERNTGLHTWAEG